MDAAVSITAFQTAEFDEWQAQLSQAIGHHRSTLLSTEIPFAAAMTMARQGEVAVVALEGQSALRLHRHQPADRAVLWLPHHGWVQERVNGDPLIAEPGSAMLCLPGDELLGETSPYLKGWSVVLPLALLGGPDRWQGVRARHLAQGRDVVALIQVAMELITSLQEAQVDSRQLVASLADHLLFWRDVSLDTWPAHSPLPLERRRRLALAREWMLAHLEQPFQVIDVAEALHVSTRTLQACFREELGRSPSLEARRLRFQRLRAQLLSRSVDGLSLEDQFRGCGLPFTPLTRRAYRDWCGETLRQSQAGAASG